MSRKKPSSPARGSGRSPPNIVERRHAALEKIEARYESALERMADSLKTGEVQRGFKKEKQGYWLTKEPERRLKRAIDEFRNDDPGEALKLEPELAKIVRSLNKGRSTAGKESGKNRRDVSARVVDILSKRFTAAHIAEHKLAGAIHRYLQKQRHREVLAVQIKAEACQIRPLSEPQIRRYLGPRKKRS
jgi:hypothetical protein